MKEQETHEELPAEMEVGRVPDVGETVPEGFDHAVAVGLRPDLVERGDAFDHMAHAMNLPFEEAVEVGHAHCQRCEVIPRKLEGPGSLHVNLPHTHTLGKVMTWLDGKAIPYGERNGIVTLQAPPGSLGPFVSPLVDVLSSTERRQTRVVYQAANEMVLMMDLFSVEDLNTFAARASADWLIDLMREKRFTSYLQPIVACEDGKSVHGYEMLLRGNGPDGLIPPSAIFSMAGQADLLFQVDQAARRSALLSASEQGVSERIFVNFSPNSIFDPAYCLDATVRLVDDLKIPREQVVFEIVEAERLPEMEHLQSIVGYYRKKGFGVALDDVGAGYASLQVLLDVRPDYAKIDGSLTREVNRDERKAILTGRLLETARDLGSTTIVEGVETEEEWAWVRERPVDLVQGFLFGRPSPTSIATTVRS